jgi:hypothetical protein
MVLLTATALTYRTFVRTDQAISEREQVVIANSAAPAIDRAKAKIEFIFQADPRFPSGVPSSDVLANMMLPHEGDIQIPGAPVTELSAGDNDDPFTLPDELRLDINADGLLDNAWRFPADVNGDGEIEEDDSGNPIEFILYSILVDDEAEDRDTGNVVARLQDDIDTDKAKALVTRTGPLATTEAIPGCTGARAESGWQVVETSSTSSLQKNFQINAFVANTNPANRTFESYEFQQSRVANRANKWGAWFRYDLDIYPGPEFNWNGAMHTDGSLIIENNLKLHMVSSHNSCVYSQAASEVTMGEFNRDTDQEIDVTKGDFQGQVIHGAMKTDSFNSANGGTLAHLFSEQGKAPYVNDQEGPPEIEVKFTKDNAKLGSDSVDKGSGRPSDVIMDPIALFTRDREEHMSPTSWKRDAKWEATSFQTQGRILNDPVSRPFVDDFYRADDRWGPKPRYDSRDPSLDIINQADIESGEDIAIDDPAYNKLADPADGLDGFWERQAIKTGLRLIMGQRLELGNTNGWNTRPDGDDTSLDDVATVANADPLYPADGSLPDSLGRIGGRGEQLQRKALYDNLAAVQALAVYHYDGGGMATNGEFPMVCMASTAHFATYDAIATSRTFNTYPSGNVRTDFLRGEGTNGWEFKYPAAYDTESDFATQIDTDGSALHTALKNLAYFAGDPKGGAPSFKAVQDDDPATGDVHPYPYQAMWGDFSPLRRVFDEYLDPVSGTATAYDNLSFADQSTLHTAACTLGMLAYNLEEEVGQFDEGFTAWDVSVQGDFSSQATSIATAMGNIVKYFETSTDEGTPTATALLTALGKDTDITNWNDPNEASEIAGVCPAGTDTAGFQSACDTGEYFAQFTFADWQTLYEQLGLGDDATDRQAELDAIESISDMVNRVAPIIRDRDMGFKSGLPSFSSLIPDDQSLANWSVDSPYTATVNVGVTDVSDLSFAPSCDPDIFHSITNAGVAASADDLLPRVVFSMIACSELAENPIKYPSLFYLFPTDNHDHAATGKDYLQPPAEDYIARVSTYGENSGYTYSVVGSGIDGYTAIAAIPQPATSIPEDDWVIPMGTLNTGSLTANDYRLLKQQSKDNGRPFAIQIGSNQWVNTPFLDHVLANGREQMPVRVLDIDVNQLASSKTPNGNDFWLTANIDDEDQPTEGVVYAFREDAVREDEIVRPRNKNKNLGDCQGKVTGEYPLLFELESDGQCYSDYEPGSEQDPPLTKKYISLKPVDFIPDPERRAYGFRFNTRNGNPSDFSGAYGTKLSTLSEGDYRKAGMTFVTNDAIYVQGHFNAHSEDGLVGDKKIIEEFKETLMKKSRDNKNPVGYGADFYNDRKTADPDFANVDVDHWRPVELLGDSVSLLSRGYVDGALADAFTQKSGTKSASFTTLSRPEFNDDSRRPSYVLTDPGETNPQNSPVWFDRNGVYYVTQWYDKDGNEEKSSDFGAIETPFNDGQAFRQQEETWTAREDNNGSELLNNVQGAEETFMNATFVSGLVPHRPRQGYGGLHNFPRFLENWGKNLFIQGSFIQLNFSTAGTAPFEQDAWEPGEDPTDKEPIGYYRPPNRRWGFDVALLYARTGPAARRFVQVSSPRSEYFRQVASDDPYIENLRCAEDADGDQVLADFCNS